MSTELVRLPERPDFERVVSVVNRLLDVVNGEKGGRLWLLDDDGERREVVGGASIDSNNYPLRVEPTSTNHVNVLHSDGSTVRFRSQDAGVTVPAITGNTRFANNVDVDGTFNADGAATFTTTVTITGALVANGAVTLGSDAADVVTIAGTLPAGTAAAPSLKIGSATDGLYQAAAGQVNVAAAGAHVATFLTAVGAGVNQPTPLRALHVVKSATTPSTITTGSNANDVVIADGGAGNGFVNVVATGNTGIKFSAPATLAAGFMQWVPASSILQIGVAASTVRMALDAAGVSFNDVTTPVAPPSLPADATDITSNNTLTNAIKDLLVDVGLAT